jgi:hypothetical protein
MILKKHKKINALLQKLTSQLQVILEDQFLGLYIGGSLATNSFHDETSDIECYIFTTGSLPESRILKIEQMHKQLYSSKHRYAKKLEVSYIPQQDLFNFDPNDKRPYFNEGCFYLGQYGSNYLIELRLLREKGITIVGPDIKNLIKAISTQDLILAIQKNLHEYWEVALDDFSKFKRSDYQVFAILTMCRTLYSLETGDITSKAEAARWAMQRVDTQWIDIIKQALAWEPDKSIQPSEEAQRFVKYVLLNAN